MIKAIIFDCWSTLFTNSQSPHPFSQFANLIGYAPGDRKFVKAFEANIMQDEYDDLRPQIRVLLDELEVPITDELVEKINGILLGSVPTQIAYPDTLETLIALKNKYKLALLTNSFKQGYDGLNERFNIESLFDYIFTSYQAHRIKPDVELFKDAMNSLGFRPDEILMIGDNLKDDIEPAKSLGMRTLLLDRKNKYPNVNDRIENIANLEKVISNL